MHDGESMNASNADLTQGRMTPVRSSAGTGSSQGSGSVAAKDDWNSGAQGSSNSQNSGSSQGSSSVAEKDDWQGDSNDRSGSQNSGAISCSTLVFTVSAHDVHTGQGIGRNAVSAITCKKSVDQQALQLMQDALTGRRLSGVTLSCKNQLEVRLNNADITGVQFASDNDAQVVEVTFAYQKAEIVHLPSGTRITF